MISLKSVIMVSSGPRSSQDPLEQILARLNLSRRKLICISNSFSARPVSKSGASS